MDGQGKKREEEIIIKPPAPCTAEFRKNATHIQKDEVQKYSNTWY